MREKYSPRELTEVVGSYPVMRAGHNPSENKPLPVESKYYLPITPRENWKLLLAGKTPYWIPRNGGIYSDVLTFSPRQNPDNVAMHLILDGGDYYAYDTMTMPGLFGLEWEYVPLAGGATVHPGNPKVKDISHWEDYITIPDMSQLDWDACREMNKEFLKTDKLRQLDIACGLWERLMALCDVENAAMAMIDEDEQDGIHRLFDRLADMYIDYITHVNECCEIDSVQIHDDMGHQNGLFFSIDTAREMIAPYLKRIVDHCHKLGLYFELHCCGKAQDLVPMFLECGVDIWSAQPQNDFDMVVERYKDAPIVLGTKGLTLPKNASDEELRELAFQWVEKFKDRKVCTAVRRAPKAFIEAVYEFSRKAYENEP